MTATNRCAASVGMARGEVARCARAARPPSRPVVHDASRRLPSLTPRFGTLLRAAFPLQLRAFVLALVLGGVALAGHAQDNEQAPYRPTPQAIVDRMLELAKVKADDYVVDLGSGDGRIVLTAATRYGARGLGVEIDRGLVRKAQQAAEAAGVADRAKFAVQDLYETPLRDVTVLTLYLLPEMNRKLLPKIMAEMQPGTRVVAQEFVVGDWPPDYQEVAAGNEEWTGWSRTRGVYLWIVPAKVGGEWRVEREGVEFPLAVEQLYQNAEARIARGDTETEVAFRPIRGREVRFTVPASSPAAGEYVGAVDGNVMSGTWSGAGGTGGQWRAVRTKRASR
jgi:16S rRNA G966 N2-methylase RsmD